jgi:CheY-like chemotaxis protein
MELERANVSISQVLDHALAMVRERAGRRSIAVELDISPDVGRVWADELKLKQVMLNLLTNAVKFTEPGGHIFVDARIVENNLEVTVRDTGIGIADDDQERIFEAFQRGGRSARTSTEGTGLGLTLSKRIVELHGGRMWMESRLREGSTFGFSIPVVRPLEGPPDVATPLATGTNVYDADRRTVVVIDDDPLDLDLLEAMLAPAGYAVVRAPSGEDGVRLVCQERPGVVLLDLVMPDMDGFEVIERLRGTEATADVPIVVLTSKELSRRDRERLSGRIDYLAQKGTLSRAALLDLVARLGEPRVPNEPEDAP